MGWSKSNEFIGVNPAGVCFLAKIFDKVRKGTR